MTDSLAFSTSLVLGLLGATHCVGMCGGIAASVSMSQTKAKSGFWLILAYNIGRISSYAVAGALIGLIGHQISSGGAAVLLRTLAGMLLIAMGLYVAQWWQLLTRLERAGGLLWRHLRPFAAQLLPADTLPRALLLGALWGWLPCGLVYSTLLWSSAAGHWHDSALLMIGFGIGTLPAMLTTGLLAQQVRVLMQNQGVRRGAGILIILFGIYTLPFSALTGSF
ncbi:hypothetical protein GCM10011352_15000 [Marinobacterium zhoushanense]|uniref:Urease accessory protein UreH-like transmembrane domain-containing protein n=1 Tax=Marinobacterium zhoushanense TaxID=1679163 RepID=A0ABQ1KAS8_9GAMM|nr:sulfite exporter TauE/SafE family protein [Marinobacterium zhoushanense]GGB89978.1 hypothetical protein GCM10011352_15000 [Marinobacterium zhoushanense]